MTNHLTSLLQLWQQQQGQQQWVLATVIATEGSSYRKPGAMMLINDLGQYYGLLSGGCLEADIMRQARRCWDTGHNRIIEYDMRDEDDLAWKLGIGCGGMVRILLQPVDGGSGHLGLGQLLSRLESGETCYYCQSLSPSSPENWLVEQSEWRSSGWQLGVNSLGNSDDGVFVSKQSPITRLAIFGGGVDARPLAAMASELGWKIKLFDPRMGYAKAAFFPTGIQIERQDYDKLRANALAGFDAVVLMNHNIKLDAASLKLSLASACSYIGILGPNHRTKRVLELAELTDKDLKGNVANPIGLDLGGELPESIALSILSQIHAILHARDGSHLSHYPLAPASLTESG